MAGAAEAGRQLPATVDSQLPATRRSWASGHPRGNGKRALQRAIPPVGTRLRRTPVAGRGPCTSRCNGASSALLADSGAPGLSPPHLAGGHCSHGAKPALQRVRNCSSTQSGSVGKMRPLGIHVQLWLRCGLQLSRQMWDGSARRRHLTCAKRPQSLPPQLVPPKPRRESLQITKCRHLRALVTWLARQ